MHKRIGTLRMLIRLVFAACAVYLAVYGAGSILHKRKMDRLEGMSGQTSGNNDAAGQKTDDRGGKEPEPAGRGPGGKEGTGQDGAALAAGTKAMPDGGSGETSLPAILPQYLALWQENEDLFGWLSIEGTQIDYPILQSDDDAYYLRHDFWGDEDRYGSIFVKSWVDIRDTGDNLVVYGHNMKDGAMFGSLKLYEKQEYYEKHRLIRLDTLYEEREYEVIGAFQSKVFADGEEGFRYYGIHELATEEEFEQFYREIKKLSLYDTEAEASYGDSFLMLSTCSYHEDDGRFVVAARRVR